MSPPRKDGVQCTAKSKTTGNQCKNAPIKGGTVCRIHGGGAPQVKAVAARRILEALVGPALVELRRLVRDPTVNDTVKLGAVRDILDRTGYKPPVQVEGYLTIDMVEQEIARLEAELALE